MAKSDHLLAILWILQSGKKVTAQYISEQLEMNIRTVYRYIDTLSASGVPIVAEAGHHGGYTLLPQFIEAPLFFDAEEQQSLYHAALFAEEAGYYGNAALNRAISKIKQHALDTSISVSTLDVIPYQSEISLDAETLLREIDQAIRSRITLHIQYCRANTEDVQSRDINPFKLTYWKHAWYVTAFCQLRGAIRHFKIDRIHKFNMTTDQFDIPDDFDDSTSFMTELLPNQNETQGELILTGDTSTIDSICQHWYFKHCLVEQDRNRAVFKIEASVLNEQVPSLLIAYGTSIQVVSPIEIKSKIIDRLYELIASHQ
ncbi:helix-turn-helix transcriptional regulator [Exiguobacterium acetylicum]|uniref:helix-turn-helix transcriptional regulator n=1 Tax=Exiguobacterium acetylicum TaxID=41170 RepID=UPI001EE3623F|nr:YafY family protein [Exiguobacterium acetylicum]UKS57307.1 YafY family transcriptional regulator [Exiguobacterium acetylicum]